MVTVLQTPPDNKPGEGHRPPAETAVRLLQTLFLNRTDRLAFAPPWGKDACPIEGGEKLVPILLAHVLGPEAPEVTVRWVTKGGKSGEKTGRFRVGTYSPGTDVRTL